MIANVASCITHVIRVRGEKHAIDREENEAEKDKYNCIP